MAHRDNPNPYGDEEYEVDNVSGIRRNAVGEVSECPSKCCVRNV